MERTLHEGMYSRSSTVGKAWCWVMVQPWTFDVVVVVDTDIGINRLIIVYMFAPLWIQIPVYRP